MLSVVVPMFNEGPIVAEMYRRVATEAGRHGSYEIVVVDDGSTDDTFERLSSLHAQDAALKVIRLARNFGHQTAVTAGLLAARGRLVGVIDGDLQDPPELLGAMIARLDDGYDVVYGIRESRKESWLKRSAYWTFYRTLQVVARIDIPLDAGDFCLMRRPVVDAVNSLPERNRFIRGLRSWVGFRQVGLKYARAARAGGDPKYTWRRLMRLALDGFIAFSDAPLRLASYLGLVVGAGAFLAIGVVLYFRLFTDRSIPGFASVAILILFIGGVQLLSVGMMGEYLGRIYDEVKQRPLYVVRETVGLGSGASDTTAVSLSGTVR